MANFCKNCGHALENGRCPICEPQAAPPPVPVRSTGNPLAAFPKDLSALFSSGDWMRIVPACGFGALAVLILLRLIASQPSVPYSFSLVLSWLTVFACGAACVRAWPYLHTSPHSTEGLLEACITASFGLHALLTLMALLLQSYSSWDFVSTGLLLLPLSLGLTEKDGLLRKLYLGGAGALALSMFLYVCAPQLYWLSLLCQCYCALCVFVHLVLKSE